MLPICIKVFNNARRGIIDLLIFILLVEYPMKKVAIGILAARKQRAYYPINLKSYHLLIVSKSTSSAKLNTIFQVVSIPTILDTPLSETSLYSIPKCSSANLN